MRLVLAFSLCGALLAGCLSRKSNVHESAGSSRLEIPARDIIRAMKSGNERDYTNLVYRPFLRSYVDWAVSVGTQEEYAPEHIAATSRLFAALLGQWEKVDAWRAIPAVERFANSSFPVPADVMQGFKEVIVKCPIPSSEYCRWLQGISTQSTLSTSDTMSVQFSLSTWGLQGLDKEEVKTALETLADGTINLRDGQVLWQLMAIYAHQQKFSDLGALSQTDRQSSFFDFETGRARPGLLPGVGKHLVQLSQQAERLAKKEIVTNGDVFNLLRDTSCTVSLSDQIFEYTSEVRETGHLVSALCAFRKARSDHWKADGSAFRKLSPDAGLKTAALQKAAAVGSYLAAAGGVVAEYLITTRSFDLPIHFAPVIAEQESSFEYFNELSPYLVFVVDAGFRRYAFDGVKDPGIFFIFHDLIHLYQNLAGSHADYMPSSYLSAQFLDSVVSIFNEAREYQTWKERALKVAQLAAQHGKSMLKATLWDKNKLERVQTYRAQFYENFWQAWTKSEYSSRADVAHACWFAAWHEAAPNREFIYSEEGRRAMVNEYYWAYYMRERILAADCERFATVSSVVAKEDDVKAIQRAMVDIAETVEPRLKESLK